MTRGFISSSMTPPTKRGHTSFIAIVSASTVLIYYKRDHNRRYTMTPEMLVNSIFVMLALIFMFVIDDWFEDKKKNKEDKE